MSSLHFRVNTVSWREKEVMKRVNHNLYFNVRGDTNIEDLAVAGKPGVGSAAHVADTNRRSAVDDTQGQFGAAGASDQAASSRTCLVHNRARGRA